MKAKAKRLSQWEEMFALQIRAAQLPRHEREFRFHKTRLWRFDFAWPSVGIAIEIEGGTRAPGKSRHTSGPGFEADCEKYNGAALNGWVVLRYTGQQVKSGTAINQVAAEINKRYGREQK